jgi:hypothetical protein
MIARSVGHFRLSYKKCRVSSIFSSHFNATLGIAFIGDVDSEALTSKPERQISCFIFQMRPVRYNCDAWGSGRLLHQHRQPLNPRSPPHRRSRGAAHDFRSARHSARRRARCPARRGDPSRIRTRCGGSNRGRARGVRFFPKPRQPHPAPPSPCRRRRARHRSDRHLYRARCLRWGGRGVFAVEDAQRIRARRSTLSSLKSPLCASKCAISACRHASRLCAHPAY